MAAVVAAAAPDAGNTDNELGKWGDMSKKETVLIAVAENG
jgi:hypothetical protein